MSKEPAEQIYAKPDAYDLEHSAHEADIDFFVRLATRLRPARLLEIACGNGRVTLPLAGAAEAWQGNVTGLEISGEMLDSARGKEGANRVTWIEGDVRTWRADHPFDLILSPCASLSHLLTLEDQLAAWRSAYENLAPGGRFVVAEVMANLPVLAESMQIPPRAAVEIDLDRVDEERNRRLLRYRSTRYHAHTQTATTHFLYDQFSTSDEQGPDRFLSDYDGHVFFPRELQLLFVATGFTLEATWGNYHEQPLGHNSRQLIVSGRK